MKKIRLIALITFSFCCCKLAYGQFSLSIEGGANFNALHHDQLPDSITKWYHIGYPTLAAGVTGRFNFFTVSLKESYLKWGYRNQDVTFTDVSGNILGTGALHHYNYSILSAFSLGVIFGNKTTLNPQVGLSMVNSIAEKVWYSLQINGSNESTVDDYRNTIFLLTVGATLMHPLNRHWYIDLSGNYGHAISNVDRSDSDWWMNNVELLGGVIYQFNSYKSEIQPQAR